MKKLIELNVIIEDILHQKITFNGSINNYLFYGNWVTQIGQKYFEEKQQYIINLLDSNIDFDKENSIKFLKQIFEEIIEVCQQMMEDNHEDLNYFKNHIGTWGANLNYPDNPPILSCSELELPNPDNEFDDRYDYIVEIMKGFYNIDDKVEKYLKKEKCSQNQEIVEEIIIKIHKLDKSELEESYAKAHLSYIISLHNQMVRNIGIYINNMLRVITKVKSFNEVDETNEGSFSNNKND